MENAKIKKFIELERTDQLQMANRVYKYFVEEIKVKTVTKESIIYALVASNIDCIKKDNLFWTFASTEEIKIFGEMGNQLVIAVQIIGNLNCNRNVVPNSNLKFRFEIGDHTEKGKIKSRYYMESKNRNGGDMFGKFYVMVDGKSFNEILLV